MFFKIASHCHINRFSTFPIELKGYVNIIFSVVMTQINDEGYGLNNEAIDLQ